MSGARVSKMNIVIILHKKRLLWILLSRSSYCAKEGEGLTRRIHSILHPRITEYHL